MKKILFALAIILASAGLKAQEVAQPQELPEPQQNYMFLSITHFFESTYLLSFEHFNKNLDRSVHLSAGLIARDGDNNSKFGGMFSVQKRFYFIDPQTHKESLEKGIFGHGIYFAPYATYKYVDAQSMETSRNNMGEIDTISQHIKSHSLQAGLLVGFQFNVGDVVFIDTYFGGGIHYPGPVSKQTWGQWDNSVYPLTYSGVVVKAGVSAGIKF